MESGVINLKKLYDFVKSSPNNQEALYGNSHLGRKFGKLCSEIVKIIPEKRGFYLWGLYDYRKLWKNIYLGKASFGKRANLKNRVLEELKDERCCFWRITCTEKDLWKIKGKYYPGKYFKEWRRSFLKTGSSHIVFVACPDIHNQDIKRIESDLIESMNPIANIKRPIPPALLNNDTTKIFNRIRHQIHSNRKNSFVVNILK